MSISLLNNFSDGVLDLLSSSSNIFLFVGDQPLTPSFLGQIQSAQKRGVCLSFIMPSGFGVTQLKTMGIEVHTCDTLAGGEHFAVSDGQNAVFSEAFLSGGSVHEGQYLRAVERPDLASDLLQRFEDLKSDCRMMSPHNTETGLMEDPFVPYYQAKIGRLLEEEAVIEEKKAEIELTMLHFEQRVLQRVGKLLCEKLEWQKKVAEIKAEHHETPDNIRAAEKASTEYFDAKKNLQLEEEASRVQLDASEETELRELYLETIKKVHPDKFQSNAEKQAIAHKIAAELTMAYRSKNLERVRSIRDTVERDLVYVEIGTVTEREHLEEIYYDTKTRVENLVNKIRNLKSSQVWNLVKEYWPNNMEEYFAQLEPALEEALYDLKSEYQTLIQTAP